MFKQTQLLKVTQVKSTLFRQGSPISHWPVSKRGPPTVVVEDYIGFLLSAGLSFLP